MKILTLKGIMHKFDGKKVLDIPELSFDKGKTYCIVGPNGSGKTTLLSIMSLLIKPTKGSIYFEDNPVAYETDNLIKVRKPLTMVLQNPYLFNMSVGKNVAYGLLSRKFPKNERKARVMKALELVGLKGFENRRARKLSGGETQLVALARALVLEPSILFLDEPTANVDSRNVLRFEETILRLNRELGSTIVMTTHNLSQAYRITADVFSLFEGSLVPSTMHNILSGRITITDKGPCLYTGKTHIWVSDIKQTSNSIHISIDPDDIIVSEAPFSSSARNHYKGIITKIIDQGGNILLEVKSDEVFWVFITKTSLKEMQLTIGSSIYLTFKASSVHQL